MTRRTRDQARAELLLSRSTKRATLWAARVPLALAPQSFGPWEIQRKYFLGPANVRLRVVNGPHQTILRRATAADVHLEDGVEVVMEDGLIELKRHLPIWLAARGRVLITGLGLGCVVRGLLINKQVTHIDVVEIDAGIIRVVGPEFAADPRVTIHHCDALQFDPAPGWDYAWHDVWCEKPQSLAILHMRLYERFMDTVPSQGIWQFPREGKRLARRFADRYLG